MFRFVDFDAFVAFCEKGKRDGGLRFINRVRVAHLFLTVESTNGHVPHPWFDMYL